ncbi:MAG: glycosyl hydrolase [Proteobacteria bacterium]|nr:glycosyl hydrolase [Pseudomonadota bacterium]
MPRLLLPLLLLASCVDDDYTRLYHTQEKADDLVWDDIGALQHLGPSVYDDGVNFGLFSARAERVELLLFDDPESDRPTQQFEMTRYDDVWNLYVEGVGPGQHYGFVAWGPNWTYDEEFYPGSVIGFHSDVDEGGNRFNPNKLLIDPYAKVLHRDHDWSRGSAASGPHRDQSTYGAAAKGVVVESTYAWQDDEWMAARREGNHHDWNELIIYETHVKGVTMNAASNQYGVEHFGTFQGLGEGASYLEDLGITAVELLPVHEKPLDGGYWGYNNISYFAPEVSYSSAWKDGGEPVQTIDEFKWMVDQLHARGIEVIVDVVYNHTGEGGLWRTKLFYNDPDGDFICDPGAAVNLDSQEVASLLTFRGIDSASYYELANGNQAYWSGSTGVGNQTRANHEPMQQLVMDSLRYYVEELHVDGFRFDLAGVLGEPDGQPSQYWSDPRDTLLNEIADDPVMQDNNIRIISEPWTTAYDGSTQYPMSETDPNYGWSEWNANFRDFWRSFLNDDSWALNRPQGAADFGSAMGATQSRYDWSGKKPYHVVNFVTAHDGFTMFDLFAYTEKENGCGPLNPICCEDACSAWCDPTSGDDNNHSRSWGDDWSKRQMMRNAFVGLMTSHGTPMMLGGDEWMRTQYGNNNTYTTWSDNEWNWFRWGEWTSGNPNNVYRHRMHDFVRDLIHFRLDHTYALSPKEWGGGMPFVFKNALNQDADGTTWGGRSILVHYYDDGNWSDENELAMLVNLEDTPVEFTLPTGRSWAIVVDTQSYYDLPGSTGEPTGFFADNPGIDPVQSYNIRVGDPTPVSGTYTVQPRSIVIVEQQR